jgi:hypothetical protein
LEQVGHDDVAYHSLFSDDFVRLLLPVLVFQVCACCSFLGKTWTDAFESDDAASSYMDVYNETSNIWVSHPSGLGQARGYLAAASLPSGLVFFAGGLTGAF